MKKKKLTSMLKCGKNVIVKEIFISFFLGNNM